MRQRSIYIWVVTEGLKLLLSERASEAIEEVAVDMVGLCAEGRSGFICSDSGNTVLELDDVLARNNARLWGEKRSRLGALLNDGRCSQNGWEKSEKNRQLHGCKLWYQTRDRKCYLGRKKIRDGRLKLFVLRMMN